mmetsp:Transcript_5735/g.8825  ORF Transcript_5735/g.8825 Transcript_5735/m.8825 type:complete len:231 (-) Transcript_5735:2004-2696(-)
MATQANNRVRVFTYGALMHTLTPLARPAYLKGFEVAMKIKGVRFLEPSFAVLLQHDHPYADTKTTVESKAWGALDIMTEQEWTELIHHERSYTVTDVRDLLYDLEDNCIGSDAEMPVYALLMDDSKMKRLSKVEINPSARYAGLLVKGAKKVKLPQHIIEKYQALERQGTVVTIWLNRFMLNGVLFRLIKYLAHWFPPFIPFLVIFSLYITFIVLSIWYILSSLVQTIIG